MIEILYMLNAPLCWDSVKLGVFIGVRQFATVITSIVTLKVSVLVHAYTKLLIRFFVLANLFSQLIRWHRFHIKRFSYQ